MKRRRKATRLYYGTLSGEMLENTERKRDREEEDTEREEVEELQRFDTFGSLSLCSF